LPAEVGPSRITAKLLTATTLASYLSKFLNEGVRMKFFSSKFSGGQSPLGITLPSM